MNDFLGRLERIRKDVFAELIDWSIGVADLVESFPRVLLKSKTLEICGLMWSTFFQPSCQIQTRFFAIL